MSLTTVGGITITGKSVIAVGCSALLQAVYSSSSTCPLSLLTASTPPAAAASAAAAGLCHHQTPSLAAAVNTLLHLDIHSCSSEKVSHGGTAFSSSSSGRKARIEAARRCFTCLRLPCFPTRHVLLAALPVIAMLHASLVIALFDADATGICSCKAFSLTLLIATLHSLAQVWCRLLRYLSVCL